MRILNFTAYIEDILLALLLELNKAYIFFNLFQIKLDIIYKKCVIKVFFYLL